MAKCFEAKKSKAGKEIKCGRCGEQIQPGEKYFYFSVGFRGSKQIRCGKHHPRPSELCGSKMSGALAANESIEDTLNLPTVTIEDIASALESAASDIESVRDEYQEGLDALPENFQNSGSAEETREKIDELDNYINSLNDKAIEIRDLESEHEEPSEDDSEAASPAEDDDLLQQAKDLAEEVLGEFSL